MKKIITKEKHMKEIINASETVVLFDIENIRDDELLKRIITLVNDDILNNKIAYHNAAYADWSNYNLKNKKQILQNSGVLLQQVIMYGSTVQKNAADIALCIDAVEFLMQDDINNYIIITGDGGFTSLVTKLKKYRKKVIIVSVSNQLSETLRSFADTVYDISTTTIDSDTESQEEIPEETIDSYIKEESEKQYFKAMWAISKSNNRLKNALSNILKRSTIRAQIAQEGIRYEVFEHTLTCSGHSKDSIRSAFTESIEKKEMYFVFIDDKETLVNKKYLQQNREKIQQITPKTETKVIPLTKEKVLTVLGNMDILLSRGSSSTDIIDYIITNYDYVSKDEFEDIAKKVALKLKTRKTLVKSMLRLLKITKANMKLVSTTPYNLCTRIVNLTGFSGVENIVMVAEEVFHWNSHELNKRAIDEKKYIKYIDSLKKKKETI